MTVCSAALPRICDLLRLPAVQRLTSCMVMFHARRPLRPPTVTAGAASVDQQSCDVLGFKAMLWRNINAEH